MRRAILVSLGVLAFGAIRLPAEHAIFAAREQQHLLAVPVDLSFREEIEQLGAIAALSGFRALIGDVLFIQAHVAWEKTEWSRMLLLFRQATTLQPHNIMFWDLAAWHMAWNASTAALRDHSQPNESLRTQTAREYIDLGRDFLARGIRNNPQSAKLYEAMARLYQTKYNDHCRAAEFYAKAAQQPDAMAYVERFAGYELSYCEGHDREAYETLRRLYDRGENERLPTLIKRLKYLEERLNIPPAERIPDEVR